MVVGPGLNLVFEGRVGGLRISFDFGIRFGIWVFG